MGDKVKTAVFGRDMRVELKDYKLSASGNKINIVESGEGYFMPEILPSSFLEWPIRKKFLLFGPRIYKRIYFVLKKGAKCIDFNDATIIYGPDTEQLKKANMAVLAQKIASDTNKGTPWYIWAIFLFSLLSLVLLLRISGVIG